MSERSAEEVTADQLKKRKIQEEEEEEEEIVFLSF